MSGSMCSCFLIDTRRSYSSDAAPTTSLKLGPKSRSAMVLKKCEKLSGLMELMSQARDMANVNGISTALISPTLKIQICFALRLWAS